MKNTKTYSVVFVIPCFNEENRLDLKTYSDSLKQNSHVKLLLVNDGSKDNTIELLNYLNSAYPSQVNILSLKKNKGKAEAIRSGVKHLKKVNPNIDYIGYIDADLATTIDEALNLVEYLHKNKQVEMTFGSRVLMVGTIISRNRFRHFIGRFVATLISNLLRLTIYDSQCGAKVFSNNLAQFVFDEPFISKWLFDVEIIARILCENEKFGEKIMKEIPLNQWIDKGESKVSSLYVFRMFYDLFKIYKSYPKLTKRPKLF